MRDDRPQGYPAERGGPGREGSPQGLHRDRVENFRLRISDEDLIGDDEELSSTGRVTTPGGEPPVLNSYSTPQGKGAAAQQRREEKRAEKLHRLRSREKGRGNRRLFRVVWLAMVVLAGLALGQYLVAGAGDMLGVGRSGATVTVEIPKGASTSQIADTLYAGGVIEKKDFFRLYSKMTKADGHYNHGTYEIKTDMDYEAIINYLQSDDNRVDTVKVTFQEGLNVQEIAALLEKNGVCTAADVLKYAASQDFENYDLIKTIANDGERYYLLEGYLFPDTYDFYKDEDPQQALGKMINNCGKKLTKDVRGQAEEAGMSLDQVLNLASIIQAESANEEDMYKVSSVLHNRLENGEETGTSQLGCDSTVFYPYRQKTLIPSNVRDTFQSRYDTYTIQGLPPGPICNPGSAAIDAALNPDKTNYYYFCHSKDGKAYYARTAEQHEKNLKKAGLKE